MAVVYFRGEGKDAGLGSFGADFKDALAATWTAGDARARRLLRSLWFDFLEAELGAMEAEALERYLTTRRVWRNEGDWPIFKTVDTPCLAYTAQVDERGVTVVALAACYDYPAGGDKAWWTQVVRPRVRALGT